MYILAKKEAPVCTGVTSMAAPCRGRDLVTAVLCALSTSQARLLHSSTSYAGCTWSTTTSHDNITPSTPASCIPAHKHRTANHKANLTCVASLSDDGVYTTSLNSPLQQAAGTLQHAVPSLAMHEHSSLKQAVSRTGNGPAACIASGAGLLQVLSNGCVGVGRRSFGSVWSGGLMHGAAVVGLGRNGSEDNADSAQGATEGALASKEARQAHLTRCREQYETRIRHAARQVQCFLFSRSIG